MKIAIKFIHKFCELFRSTKYGIESGHLRICQRTYGSFGSASPPACCFSSNKTIVYFGNPNQLIRFIKIVYPDPLKIY